MTDRTKNIAVTAVFALALGAFFAAAVLKPDGALSPSERRRLAQFPEVKAESVLNGDWMEDFEKHALDQFPLRGELRSLKAALRTGLFLQLENNGYYTAGGQICKVEYPLNEASVRHVASLLAGLGERYFPGSGRVFYAVIPDKNVFFAERRGHLALDYGRMLEILRGELGGLSYIDLFDTVTGDSFYKTDTHWDQKKLLPVVSKLGSAMGFSVSGEYEERVLAPFFGVYHGQSALPFPGEELTLLTNAALGGAKISFLDEKTLELVPAGYDGLYDIEKFGAALDPYDVFLSGAVPLAVIENENAPGGELVVFRDSFGGSLSPLLAEAYSKVTVVDLRYINSSLLGRFVDFSGADVLFIYSTLILNNGMTMR